MIQLLPVTEQSFIDRLNKAYKTEAAHAYACVEKKEIKATCLYNIEKGKGIILNVSSVEDAIFDGLVRAVFASLLEMGIDRAEFGRDVPLDTLVRLGFVQDDTRTTPSIREMMEKHKNCANP